MRSELVKSAGIYAIRCMISGRRYIGSTGKFWKRWTQHRVDLRGGYHHSGKLQRAWNKHGDDNFSFDVLEVVTDISLLRTREQTWLDLFDAFRSGYNECPIAADCTGRRHTPETRAKMRAASLGRVISPETRAKISIASKAASLESRLRGIQKRIGGRRSPETRARMRAAQLGKKASPETRAKLSAITSAMPQAHRDKLAASLRGRKTKPHTAESRAKMSEAKRIGWARKKAAAAALAQAA